MTRSTDYDRVYRQKPSWATSRLVLRSADRGNAAGVDVSRYGFSISKRVGGAVARNRVRRRLREIMRQLPLKPGQDIVLIVRQPAVEADYKQLRVDVVELLMRAGLLGVENEGHRPEIN